MSGTQYLIKDASEGVDDMSCLWLRGLLLQQCISNVIPATLVIWFVFSALCPHLSGLRVYITQMARAAVITSGPI